MVRHLSWKQLITLHLQRKSWSSRRINYSNWSIVTMSWKQRLFMSGRTNSLYSLSSWMERSSHKLSQTSTSNTAMSSRSTLFGQQRRGWPLCMSSTYFIVISSQTIFFASQMERWKSQTWVRPCASLKSKLIGKLVLELTIGLALRLPAVRFTPRR